MLASVQIAKPITPITTMPTMIGPMFSRNCDGSFVVTQTRVFTSRSAHKISDPSGLAYGPVSRSHPRREGHLSDRVNEATQKRLVNA
jgi:hypothetical protein